MDDQYFPHEKRIKIKKLAIWVLRSFMVVIGLLILFPFITSFFNYLYVHATYGGETARQTWEEQGSDEYFITVHLSPNLGAVLWNTDIPLHIADGELVNTEEICSQWCGYFDIGQYLPAEVFNSMDSKIAEDQLFSTVLKIEFDEQYGYLTHFEITTYSFGSVSIKFSDYQPIEDNP